MPRRSGGPTVTLLVLMPWVYSFVVSYILVAPFVAWLRPNWYASAAGATLVAVAALFIELAAESAVSPLVAATIVLVVIGPLTEEVLKFLTSGALGANFASAAGVGIGFAASENALYFWAAWGSPLDALILLIAIRATTDPLLHSTATTLSTLTWRGEPWGFPAGLALHMSWNFATLVYVLVDPLAGLLLLLAAGLAVLGIMLLLRRSPIVRDELDNSTRLHAWTGEVATGA